MDINNMKVVVINIRPGGFTLQVRLAVLGFGYFPDQSGCFGHQDQKQSLIMWILWQICLCQLMFAGSRGTIDDWQRIFFGPAAQAAAEPAGHVLQMFLVQAVIGTVEITPPGSKATALLSKGKVAVEHNAVDTVIVAIEKIFVI
jgi:hypothetical protein